MNCFDVIAQYPNFEQIHAGGAAVGWRHPTSRGGYILITCKDGPGIPSRRATRVMVGRYDRRDASVGGTSVIPVAKLEAWIDKQVLGLSESASQADTWYMSVRLLVKGRWRRVEIPADSVLSGAKVRDPMVVDAAEISRPYRKAQTFKVQP